MKYKFFLILLFFLTIFISCSSSTDLDNKIKEEHFDFTLYNGLSSTNITEISKELENNYKRILNDLQVLRMPKVIVKIWADYNSFLEAMGTDIGIRYEGATGYVFGMTEFRIYYTPQSAVAAVHEFAHLVSMHINSRIPNNPRWLWEAVALYENNEFVNPKTIPYLVSGNYPTLNELNTDYTGSNHYIYSVGYVLLQYVVETWGMDNVINLIKNNGNISNLLGITTQEFEHSWYQFIEEKYLN